MGIVEQHWAKRRVRPEEGIYHATDEVSELCGGPDEGYRVDHRAPVKMLQRDDPSGWVSLTEVCNAQAGDWQVFAGATSLEGAGFIAVENVDTRKLEWVLHVRESEEFIELWTNGEMIRAISSDGSVEYRWSIPISDPELFTVRRNRRE
jgi:hypothetical protein